MTTLIEPTPADVHSPPKNSLLGRYQSTTHGSVAEDEMVRTHLPLVKTVVGRIAMTLPAHVAMDDLYSAGLVGLLNGVRNFKPNGGSTFESYARVRIRGAILDELRKQDWVPRSVHDKAKKVQAVIRKLEQEDGEIPSAEKVAAALGVSDDEYEQLLIEIKPATLVCLDAAQDFDDSGDSSHHDEVADDLQPNPGVEAANHELAGLIKTRLQELPEMQRKVLGLYYFEDLRLREIAAVFGVTESRICQIHAQAILNLRSFLQRREATEAGSQV